LIKTTKGQLKKMGGWCVKNWVWVFDFDLFMFDFWDGLPWCWIL